MSIQIDTKQLSMRERMVSTLIDYKKMRLKDQFEIEKISNPLVDRSIFPDTASQGTRILIRNVCDQFWETCTVPVSHKLKDELQQEISEKYSLYICGMAPLRDALLKRKAGRAELLDNVRNPDIGMDSLPQIEILIDGESMSGVRENRVVQRLATIAGTSPYEDGAEGDEGESLPLIRPSPTAKEPRGPQRPSLENADDTESRGMADAGKPCWYTTFKVQTRTGTSSAMAHVRSRRRACSSLLGIN